MAKLLSKPYPGNWDIADCRSPEEFDDQSRKHDRMFAEIPKNRIWSAHVGYGTALYYIVSCNPPVLQWIPYRDAWQAHPATIRGLRARDLQGIVGRETLAQISAGRK